MFKLKTFILFFVLFVAPASAQIINPGQPFPPTGCITPNGIIFNNATPCDSGFIKLPGSTGAITATGKFWIDIGGSENSTRAAGLTVSSPPGVYTPGSDPGDGARILTVAGRSSDVTTGIVFGLARDTQNGRLWDMVAYVNVDHKLDINNNAGGYHTVATLDGNTNSLFLPGFIVTGPAAVNCSICNSLSANAPSLNVSSIQNTSTAGYSAINALRSDGVEQTAWGYGNSGVAAVFAGTAFWEGSGINTLSIIINSNTGRLGEFSSSGFDMYDNSHSIMTAYGPHVFGVTRSNGNIFTAGNITVPGGAAPVLSTTASITSGGAAGVGTLTNAPVSGNPTKWVPINDNGTTRYYPVW